jgi:hypothetical protein
VTDLRLDHLKPEDLIFGINVLNAAGQQVSETMLKAAAYKTLQHAEKNVGSAYNDMTVKDAFARSIGNNRYIKADEIMAANLATAGQEWVTAAYDNRLWERVRSATMYQQLLSRGIFEVPIGQGENTVYIPVEGAGITWYTLTSEQNDLETDERLPVAGLSSKPITARRQLTPGYVMARTPFTDILEEDSIIPVLPFVRSTHERDAEEQIEYILMNGDTRTTANANINLIDGTPTVDTKGRGPAYLASLGFLYYGLETAGYNRDASTTLDEDDYLNTYGLLTKPLRTDKRRLMFVIDSETELATMRIPTLKTRDVNSNATIESGQLTRIWGIDVLMSAFIEKANSAGKISATSANNTLGRIACIRPDRFAIAWKRQTRTEVARDIDAQATVVVSSMRFGMISNSIQPGVAVTRNVPLT